MANNNTVQQAKASKTSISRRRRFLRHTQKANKNLFLLVVRSRVSGKLLFSATIHTLKATRAEARKKLSKRPSLHVSIARMMETRYMIANSEAK